MKAERSRERVKREEEWDRKERVGGRLHSEWIHNSHHQHSLAATLQPRSPSHFMSVG